LGKLQLKVLRGECDRLAVETSRRMFGENDVGFVYATSIIECREDLDICEGRY
jgi:hypothetical protein